MSDYVIQAKGLVKSYSIGDEKITILKKVSLDIKKGEFVSIIGPSGSGKSTFMNIIGCLDLADNGEYVLDGKSITSLSEDELSAVRNKTIGFIFQSFNLLNKLSALENIELPLIYQGKTPKERRKIALECLKKVGLQDKLNNRPNQLSGGQQQRVAIARALATNPQILLADEPTGALDSKTSKEILEILEGLNQEGKTIIMITHDMDIARNAKRLIRIRDGEIFE
ncbi:MULTISPECIES: ABC transporter ATP-binding protein [unclassified Clostridioides]|uniref:ABC transporter ATP-binding protein n=1 Tax=unclassified Clostridioides TaxID=2635829 RepID=UPI001D100A85|nr:ABC transporter ATP-binding protein [Clostridioides sp. ZZV14-6150]MCC0662061.1 ABC transporter ATP-binding protein [Clostridioides sp. ZZV14-6154]MCC0670185.1 ABC transporter ATP-binding protein [Clostridioides sp. ZZV14-6153]MCC0720391.1 ABC transporter ATP-binding protein [Clostridioides sp. ZZV14-6105]MCC0724362.1 ABC transporter ATP-binding protein [Clostridioides sp. ZZV14-6104]MCC0728411.1 ABC transporter ATP-binding protein [Clostridioides sp. ZZV14-6045]MCC0732690.1 ABC transporte